MAAWAEANVRGGAKGQGGAVAAVGGVGRGPGDARRMSMAYTKADEKYVEGAAGAGSEVIGALEPRRSWRIAKFLESCGQVRGRVPWAA